MCSISLIQSLVFIRGFEPIFQAKTKWSKGAKHFLAKYFFFLPICLNFFRTLVLVQLTKTDRIDYTTPVNCFRKRTSFCEYKRRSFTWYFNWVIRSTPIPKAKPVYLLESISKLSNTLG